MMLEDKIKVLVEDNLIFGTWETISRHCYKDSWLDCSEDGILVDLRLEIRNNIQNDVGWEWEW